GIFSGSLSTISSALNSLSTVTVLDFIKPLCATRKLKDIHEVYIAKALSLLFGLLCICMAFGVSRVDSLLAVNNALISITEGPVLAIFLVGILSRKGSQRCILFGFIVGFVLTSWIGYGIIFSGQRPASLTVETSGCPSSLNSSVTLKNITTTCEGLEQCATTIKPVTLVQNDPFVLYKISYVWISPIGLSFTLCAIFLAILFTGNWSHNVIPANSRCLSPVTRLWMKGSRHQELPLTSEEQTTLTAMDEFQRPVHAINK
ncbi:unnamed protein product, partial [Larinioides sclopetarius]